LTGSLCWRFATPQEALKGQKMAGSFAKRASRVISSLVKGANEADFTPLASYVEPVVAEEDFENIENTVNVLQSMDYIEVSANEQGALSIRLTPSGVDMASTLK